jgi:hypothetical protein
MSPGDHVIYVVDPLRFGVLEFLDATHDGRLWCEQLNTGDVHLFKPHEVDLHPDLYEQRMQKAA